MITIIKDYRLPFAKNDDYIYLDSTKKNQTQFKYGMRFLFEELEGTATTSSIVDGYVDFTIIGNPSSYSGGDMVYLNVESINSVQYNPVPLRVISIEDKGSNVYRFNFDINKLKGDSSWWLYALENSPSISAQNTWKLNKTITKMVAPNSEGYGVFSVNDIMRNLMAYKPFDFNSDDVKIDFKYLPFEYFFYKQPFESIESISTFLAYESTFGGLEDDKLTFFSNDFVVVEYDSSLESNEQDFEFYKGTQQLTSFIFSNNPPFWKFITNKPAIYGDFTHSGFIYRADYSATPFTDESKLSSNKVCYYTGLKDSDLSGKSDVDVLAEVDSYISGDNSLSYSPIVKTYSDNYGLRTYIAPNNNTQITYSVVGVGDFVFNLTNSSGDVVQIPVEPMSILEAYPSVDLSNDYSVSFGGVVLNYSLDCVPTKFDRVQLLFSDELGSLNSFNFNLYNSRKSKVSKETFSQERKDFSSLNIVKYNNQSRGMTDVASQVDRSMVLNTDFLNQEEGDYFEDLLLSNNVYANYKGEIYSINIKGKSIKLKDSIKGKIRYSLEISFSNKLRVW